MSRKSINLLTTIFVLSATAFAQNSFSVGDRVVHIYNSLYRGVIVGSEGAGSSKCYYVKNDDRSVPDRCLMANELKLEAKSGNNTTSQNKPSNSKTTKSKSSVSSDSKSLSKLFGSWGTAGFAETSTEKSNGRVQKEISVSAVGVVTIRADGTYSWGSKKGKWVKSSSHSDWGPIVLKGAGTRGEDYWVRADGKTKCDSWQKMCVPNLDKIYLRNADGTAYTGIRRGK